MASILIQDACVLINLAASGRFQEIATQCGFQFAISSIVSKEALFLRDEDSGERERINLGDFVDRGMLTILTVQSEAEQLRFIELAMSLDDGEAEAIAIAEKRKYALATDDRKARNVILRQGLQVEIWSTCKLIQHWQQKCSISEVEVGIALASISSRAKYRPKPGHADCDWWNKLCPK